MPVARSTTRSSSCVPRRTRSRRPESRSTGPSPARARAGEGPVDRLSGRRDRVRRGTQLLDRVVDLATGIHPEADPQEHEHVGQQLSGASGGGVCVELHGPMLAKTTTKNTTRAMKAANPPTREATRKPPANERSAGRAVAAAATARPITSSTNALGGSTPWKIGPQTAATAKSTPATTPWRRVSTMAPPPGHREGLIVLT